MQDEKSVLTTMERRLQERCAELQREVFRLQGAHNNEGYKSLEKHPVALPRQVLPRSNSKNGSSEHEDEGISSSETGQSLSPEPILILPQNASMKKYSMMDNDFNSGGSAKDDDNNNTTIEEVIEELENIVHDAEQEIRQENKQRSDSIKSSSNNDINLSSTYQLKSHVFNKIDYQEKEIVPKNLLPQPPKKSRSLSHLLAGGSDFDDSDYGALMANNETRISYYDDIDMEIEHSRQYGYHRNEVDGCEPNPDLINQTSTNRELLNVIMDARDKDENIFMAAPGRIVKAATTMTNKNSEQSLIPKSAQAPQKFNGVFFMTEMSTPAKYPKPDITAALEARRVSKSIERLESYGSGGLDSMIDIVMTSEKKQEFKNAMSNSRAPNSFAVLRDMSMNTTFSMRTKSPAPDGHQPAVIFSNGVKATRMAYTISGSKLTDLPSGLY